MKTAWIFYLFSIAFGVLHLMALTGTLGKVSPDDLTPESIYNLNSLIWATAQILSFLFATAMVIAYGFQADADEPEKSPTQTVQPAPSLKQVIAPS